MTDEDLEALARVALAQDFDPVPWEDAPAWRQIVSKRIAESAVRSSGMGRAEQARSAWTLAMTTMGWSWAREVDEVNKKHPGVVMGELTTGGVRHWNNVVDAIRDEARLRGLRLTGE
jgi:hypothetical protein